MSQEHPNASGGRTRSQRHAERALARVNAVADASMIAARQTAEGGSNGRKDFRKEYKARADGFPAMVMQAGLAQAVGFMRAKGAEKGSGNDGSAKGDEPTSVPAEQNAEQNVGQKSEQRDTRNTYRRYLDDLATVIGLADGDALQTQTIEAGLPAYRWLTREALAAAVWLKRFGQVYLSDKDGRR